MGAVGKGGEEGGGGTSSHNNELELKWVPRFKSAQDKGIRDLTPLQLELLFGD